MWVACKYKSAVGFNSSFRCFYKVVLSNYNYLWLYNWPANFHHMESCDQYETHMWHFILIPEQTKRKRLSLGCSNPAQYFKQRQRKISSERNGGERVTGSYLCQNKLDKCWELSIRPYVHLHTEYRATNPPNSTNSAKLSQGSMSVTVALYPLITSLTWAWVTPVHTSLQSQDFNCSHCFIVLCLRNGKLKLIPTLLYAMNCYYPYLLYKCFFL